MSNEHCEFIIKLLIIGIIGTLVIINLDNLGIWITKIIEKWKNK